MSKAASKLSALTLTFWLMKIAATTLGETGGDLLAQTLNVGYAASSLIFITFFFATLAGQLAAKSYHPLLYWLVILSTSTAGTTISDYLDRTLHLGYPTGAAILLTLLLAVLAAWKLSGASLNVQNIKSLRVETYYWVAILISNTLGTAAGDFLADSSGLGFAGGALLITGVLAVITAAYYYTRISRIALFWAAFVLTRPFGATVGDFLTKSHAKGGLDLGTIGASSVLAAILLALVAHEISRRKSRI